MTAKLTRGAAKTPAAIGRLPEASGSFRNCNKTKKGKSAFRSASGQLPVSFRKLPELDYIENALFVSMCFFSADTGNKTKWHSIIGKGVFDRSHIYIYIKRLLNTNLILFL